MGNSTHKPHKYPSFDGLNMFTRSLNLPVLTDPRRDGRAELTPI